MERVVAQYILPSKQADRINDSCDRGTRHLDVDKSSKFRKIVLALALLSENELELGVRVQQLSTISRQSQAWQHSLLAQEYYFGYHIFDALGID